MPAPPIGHAFAQHIHGRVVADLLITDFGKRHRFAHASRRAGLGVRQQVDANGGRLRIARGRGVGHGGVSIAASWRGVIAHGIPFGSLGHPRFALPQP